jgi:uncharacterized cupredoxin-like copper-binding protein
VSPRAAGRAVTRSLPNIPIMALLVAAIALAGCGSSSNSSSSTAASAAAPATSTPASTSSGAASSGPLALAANPEGQLKYDKTSLSAKAGTVTINFTNKSTLAHNVTIATPSGTVLGATPTFEGGSRTLSVALKPGTYKFYCSVPGHRQAGMEGTLTVQ